MATAFTLCVFRCIASLLIGSDPQVEGLAQEIDRKWGDISRDLNLELAGVSPGDKSALAKLVKLLRHEDVNARRFAILAIGEYRESAEATIGILSEIFEADESRACGEAAAESLGKLSSKTSLSLDILLGGLKSKEAEIRCRAVLGLGSVTHSDKVLLEALVHALGDSDYSVRLNAVAALQKLRRRAKPALEDLEKAYASSSGSLRVELAVAIGFADLASIPPKIIPGLICCLKDANPEVGRRAAQALGQFGSYKQFMLDETGARRIYGLHGKQGGRELDAGMPSCLLPAVNALADMVAQTDGDIRMTAIDALVEMRWGSDRSVWALVEALKDDDPYIRARTVTALGCCGVRAKAAVPNLREVARKDAAGLVRINAAACLWEIDGRSPEWTEVVLECATKDSNPHTRLLAIATLSLGVIGKGDKRVMTVIKQALKDENEMVRESARRHIQKNEGTISE